MGVGTGDGGIPADSAGFPWEWVQNLREVLRDGTEACGNTEVMELIFAGNPWVIIQLWERL